MRQLSAVVACLCLIVTGTAWAIVGHPVELTGTDSDEIPVQSITFVTEDGIVVPVEENDDDDDGIFVILFPGDTPTAGRLIIDRPGGDQIIDVPAGQPGETLVVDLDTEVAFHRPDPSTDSYTFPPSIGLSYDYRRFDLPGFGVGTVIEGMPGNGNERPLALLTDAIDLTGGTFGLFTPTPGLSFADYCFTLISQATGDDQDSGSIAINTNYVAMTYQDFSPSNATGVFLGMAGLDAAAMREVDMLYFKSGLGRTRLSDNGRTSFNHSVFLTYGHVETGVNSWITTPSYNDISQSTQLDIEQKVWTLGVGGSIREQFNNRWSAEASLYGLLVNSDTEMRSVQDNVCGLCGAGNNFTSTVTDNDDDFGIGAVAGASLNWDLSPKLSISLGAEAVYLPSVSGVFNPTSGDDLFVDNRPIELVDDSGWLRSVKFGVRFGF